MNTELLSTANSQVYYNSIDILSSHQIKYSSKIVNQRSPGLLNFGTSHRSMVGMNPDCMNMYYIYVNRNQLSLAKELLNL
jgi:hypothetical protein